MLRSHQLLLLVVLLASGCRNPGDDSAMVVPGDDSLDAATADGAAGDLQGDLEDLESVVREQERVCIGPSLRTRPSRPPSPVPRLPASRSPDTRARPAEPEARRGETPLPQESRASGSKHPRARESGDGNRGDIDAEVENPESPRDVRRTATTLAESINSLTRMNQSWDSMRSPCE